MKPPTINELRKLADEEDRSVSFHQTQLDHHLLTCSERATEESMKRKARIYAHALRIYADTLRQWAERRKQP